MPRLPAILRRHATHAEEIIRAVEARAPAMSDDERRFLVRGLEREHSEAETKPLCQLLEARRSRVSSQG